MTNQKTIHEILSTFGTRRNELISESVGVYAKQSYEQVAEALAQMYAAEFGEAAPAKTIAKAKDLVCFANSRFPVYNKSVKFVKSTSDYGDFTDGELPKEHGADVAAKVGTMGRFTIYLIGDYLDID